MQASKGQIVRSGEILESKDSICSLEGAWMSRPEALNSKLQSWGNTRGSEGPSASAGCTGPLPQALCAGTSAPRGHPSSVEEGGPVAVAAAWLPDAPQHHGGKRGAGPPWGHSWTRAWAEAAPPAKEGEDTHAFCSSPSGFVLLPPFLVNPIKP